MSFDETPHASRLEYRMRAYRVEKIVLQDGVLELCALPFSAGEVVEVIILSREDKVRKAHAFPLQGKVLRYEKPTEPRDTRRLGSLVVILLDTHIWVWWVDDSQQLTDRQRHIVLDNVCSGLGISVMSCWEVAKLVEYGR